MEKLTYEYEQISGNPKKPLSIAKLMSAGLLAFTVPEKTTLVIDKEVQDGDRVTGFLNSDNELVGWGLTVWDTTRTIEVV